MLSNLFSSKEENLSLASCGTFAFCNNIDCLLNYCALVGSLILAVWLGDLLDFFSCHPVIMLFWSMIYCLL